MNASLDNTAYQQLSPERVLDAVEGLGMPSDARILALNSYENRVYQVGLEEGPPVVVKFYRPRRWTDEAILEEHRFALELAERELPVVAPLVIGEQTLHRHKGFRFAVFPRQTGRWPELDDPDNLLRIGRFLGRLHAVGALRVFYDRPRLSVADMGEAS
ncbi:MAG: serine/threonine protein kinase, partial [Candidatus Competibacteraceae bacterium]|nr:serine/threonine protein kinase [Candidatus Competibacteraceae bacterium]